MRLRSRFLRDCNVSDQGCSKTASCERFNDAFANGDTSWPRHLFTGRQRRVEDRCLGILAILLHPCPRAPYLLRARPQALSCSATLRRTMPAAPTSALSPLVTFPDEATRSGKVIVAEQFDFCTSSRQPPPPSSSQCSV